MSRLDHDDGVEPSEMQHTYVIQDNQGLGPTAIGVADGIKEAMPGHGGDELFEEEDKQSGADEGQDEVVDQE